MCWIMLEEWDLPLCDAVCMSLIVSSNVIIEPKPFSQARSVVVVPMGIRCCREILLVAFFILFKMGCT